jgi:hypothetical protein
MDDEPLGRSGLRVPWLSSGATASGRNWGRGARLPDCRRLIEIGADASRRRAPR